jgi:anti-sigma B factor antagonist
MDDSVEADTSHGITVEDVDGTTLVRLYGEIDVGLRDSASQCMVTVLAGMLVTTAPIVVDTSAVTFIDSSGLAFLLQLHAVAADAGRGVVLRDPSGAVVDLLALVGLDGMFAAESHGV